MDQQSQKAFSGLVVKMPKKNFGLRKLFGKRQRREHTTANPVKSTISPAKTDESAISSVDPGDLGIDWDGLDQVPNQPGDVVSRRLETNLSWDDGFFRRGSTCERRTRSLSPPRQRCEEKDEPDLCDAHNNESDTSMDWVTDLPGVVQIIQDDSEDDDSLGSLEVLMQHMVCGGKTEEGEHGTVEDEDNLQLMKSNVKSNIFVSIMDGLCSG